MVDLTYSTQYLFAATTLLVAGYLFAARFNNGTIRAFAIFLTFRAIVTISNSLRQGGGHLADAMANFSTHALFWTALAAIWFVIRYGAGKRPPILIPVTLMASGVAASMLFISDRCIAYCNQDQIGPLWLLVSLIPLVLCFAPILILRQSADQGRIIVSGALLIVGMLEAGLAVGALARLTTMQAAPPLSIWAASSYMTATVALMAGISSLIYMRTHGAGRHWILWATISTAIGATVIIMAGNELGTITFVLLGLVRLSLPVVIGVALARHMLFDIDNHVRWTLSKGVLAAFFFASFFAVSEFASAELSERWGTGLGILAASGLVFGLTPLHNMANRFADTMMPRLPSKNSERLALYEEQATLMWSDGAMTRRERLALDNLRKRLEVPIEAAAEIETRVLSGHGSPG